ncbi:hypothetical protein B0H13DRAFT_1889314 [Mycena leptocephala]|nr:hypothetical protein B0H13DRAFT_1889314 [Mycena leptocephala]
MKHANSRSALVTLNLKAWLLDMRKRVRARLRRHKPHQSPPDKRQVRISLTYWPKCLKQSMNSTLWLPSRRPSHRYRAPGGNASTRGFAVTGYIIQSHTKDVHFIGTALWAEMHRREASPSQATSFKATPKASPYLIDLWTKLPEPKHGQHPSVPLYTSIPSIPRPGVIHT